MVKYRSLTVCLQARLSAYKLHYTKKNNKIQERNSEDL